MKSVSYPASIVEHAPDDFVVTFPDIPEAVTGGSSREEAMAEAVDALAVAIEGILAEGREPPSPSTICPHLVDVPVRPAVAARSLLLRAMRDQHLTKVDISRRMNQDEKAVRRIVSGQNASLELTLKALAAVGVHAGLSVQDDVDVG